MLLILHLSPGLGLRLICFTGTNIDHVSETPLNPLTARSDQMKLLPIISLHYPANRQRANIQTYHVTNYKEMCSS